MYLMYVINLVLTCPYVKSEARNTKQTKKIRNPNILNKYHSSICFLHFEFVSDFDIRISDLNCKRNSVKLQPNCPSAVRGVRPPSRPPQSSNIPFFPRQES